MKHTLMGIYNQFDSEYYITSIAVWGYLRIASIDEWIQSK